MRPILGMIIATTLATGPGATAADKLVQPERMEFQNFGNTSSLPGGGFDYKKMSFTGYDCLAGRETEPTGKPESNLDFSMSLDSESVKRELGVSADFKTKAGAGELSGAAKFSKAASESSTSITMNYVGSIHFANRNFEQTGLNTYAQSLKNLPVLLENACGQGFVKQIVRGAKIFFSIRFEFGSRDDKEAFAAELHYNSPMSSFNASVSSNAEKISKHARVTISAYQVGGQVEKLAFIFKNTPKGSLKDNQTERAGGAKAHYAAIECAMGAGLSECKQALNDALAYATDEHDLNSFPNQINSKLDPKSPEVNNLVANLSYWIVPYAYPEMVKIPGLNEAVQEQKNSLLGWLNENVDYLYKIDGLRRGVIKYTERQKDVFSAGEAVLRARQKLIIDTAVYCYQRDEVGCGSKVEELQKRLDGLDNNGKPVIPNPYAFDVETLNPMPETFAQFCAATHSIRPKYVTIGQRESVMAIEEIMSRKNGPLYSKLNTAGYFNEASDSIRRCAILEDVLTVQNELDLAFRKETYKISDLQVIANFTRLQKLILRGQNVRSVEALGVIENQKPHLTEGFKDLKYLDLEDNRIGDITPLANNKSLETLRLAGNRIGSVSALQALPSLELLDIRKNLPSAQCFEAPSLNQCMLARAKWLVQFTNTANTLDLGMVLGQVTEFLGGHMVSGARRDYRSSYIAVLESQVQTPSGFNASPGNLQYGHVWSADTAIDDKHVLVSGGWPNQSMKSIEIYDVSQGARVAAGSMADARAGHTATLLNNGLVLVAGGYNSAWSLGTESAQSTAELIDPKDPNGPRVVQRLEMNAPRAWHTATKLPDGRVVMIGGFAGSRGVRMMEVFDPSLNRFLPLGNLQQARGGHSVTELPDGKFLVAGGFKDNASAVGSAEILDTKTLTTRLAKGAMNFARGLHMVQRLPNGEIVFVGGMSQPYKVDPNGDDDGLNLIEMMETSFGFKMFADRDENGQPTDKKHFGICRVCLDSAEVYLPQEESFVTNPESLNSPRAGSAVVPVNTSSGSFSFRIWGGIDSATSTSLESGSVTEDILN